RNSNWRCGPGLLLGIVESPSKRVLLGAQMAREDLESGFTTVRNLGHSGIDGDTELRDAINAGRVPGPRILASARKLITRGEYVQNLNPALADSIEHGNEATDEQFKSMRDKGIFLDITPTFWSGFFKKITEPSIVMSPAAKSQLAASDERRRQKVDNFIQRILKSGVKFAAGSD